MSHSCTLLIVTHDSYNLACHKDLFGRLADAGIIRTLVGVVRRSTAPGTTSTALRAAYNLSCFRVCRARMIDEDLVRQLPNLLQAVGRVESLQAQLAVTVSNLALMRSAVDKIISGGAVRTLVKLYKIGTDRTKQLVGVALADMTETNIQQEKFVTQGGLPPLIELAFSRNKVLKVKAATALCNLSNCAPIRSVLISLGAVQALVHVSRSRSEDAKRMCSVALCNLVNDVADDSRAAVERGAMGSLVSLATTGSAVEQERCAMAMSELSNRPSLRKVLVEVGALPILRRLIRAGHPLLQQFAVATLVNLSRAPECRAAIIFDTRDWGQPPVDIPPDVISLTHLAGVSGHASPSKDTPQPETPSPVRAPAPTPAAAPAPAPREAKAGQQEQTGPPSDSGSPEERPPLVRSHSAGDAPRAGGPASLLRQNTEGAPSGRTSRSNSVLMARRPPGRSSSRASLASEPGATAAARLRSGSATPTRPRSETAALSLSKKGAPDTPSVAASQQQQQQQRPVSASGTSVASSTMSDYGSSGSSTASSSTAASSVRQPQHGPPWSCSIVALVAPLVAPAFSIATDNFPSAADGGLEMSSFEPPPAVARATGGAAAGSMRFLVASVVSNLSFCKRGREALVAQGATELLSALLKQGDDENTRLQVAVALANLSASAEARRGMILGGAVKVRRGCSCAWSFSTPSHTCIHCTPQMLVFLAQTSDERMKPACAQALHNLTCYEGLEAVMVDDGAVLALMIVALFRSDDVSTKNLYVVRPLP